MFVVHLPPPPSVNRAFANVAKIGRVKTTEYKNWRKAAAWSIVAEVPAARRIEGLFRLRINLPRTLAGDIDNRVKGIVDALVSSGRVDDDKHMGELHVYRLAPSNLAIIKVQALA